MAEGVDVIIVGWGGDTCQHCSKRSRVIVEFVGHPDLEPEELCETCLAKHNVIDDKIQEVLTKAVTLSVEDEAKIALLLESWGEGEDPCAL